MAAPFTFLDLRADVNLAGTWTSATSLVYQRNPVTVTRGRPDISSTLSPSQANFTVNNTDGRWTIRNPVGAWYGQLVQNTPLRLSVPSSLAGIAAYLRLETDDASYASTPDTAGTPPVHVHTSSGTGTGASLTVTIPSTTAGNCLIAAIRVDGSSSNPTVSTVQLNGPVTDNWASFTGNIGTGPFSTGAIWADPNCAGGKTSVIVTPTGGSGTITIDVVVWEFSGIALTSPGDKTANNGGIGTTSTSWSSGATATLTQANEVAVGLDCGLGTLTGPASPWVNTNVTPGSVNMVAGYNIVSSTSAVTYAGTASPASGSTAIVATFKAASSGSPLQITSGTLSARVDCKITDWAGNHVLAAKWGATGKSWAIWTNGDGTIQFAHYDGSTIYSGASSLPLPYFGQRLAIRVDYNIGAQTITYFTAPTMAGSWTQLGSVFSTAATVLSGAAGQAVQVGAGTTNLAGMFGEVYEAQLLSTGTPVADPVFTSQTPGAGSFTDAQSNVWTLAGTSEISGRLYRFHGELSSLPKAADPSGNDVYSDAAATGITARLQAQQTPADSAMKRAYVRLPASLNLAAYWPAEDTSGATQIGQAVGANPMGNAGLTMASSNVFACSGALPVMNSGTATATVDPTSVTWTDNVIRFLLAFSSSDDTPANNAIIARFYTQGTVARVDLRYGTGGGLQMLGYNAAGTAVITGTTWGFGLPVVAECRISVELLGSGNYNLWVVTPDGVAHGGGSTFSGSIGGVTGVAFGGGLSASAMGHFSVQGVSDSVADLTGPLTAWLGETAGNRFSRLAGEEGYNCRITGPADRSVPMGVQTQQTISALLQEIESTDQGLMTEPRQCLGVGYITNWALCNQPALVTADYSQAQLMPGFTPASDTQLAINDVTATAADGSSSRQILATGNMSIAAIGRFDTSITVNPSADSELASMAGWYLHVRSADEDRYPSIPFQMARASTPTSVALADIGHYVAVINTPGWVPPGPARQLVAGLTETFMPQPQWGITFNGIPEAPYEVLILDDPVYGRLDTDGSALCASATSVATSLLAASAGVPWTTAGGDLPFDLGIGGERVTLTAVGNGGTGSSTSPAAHTQLVTTVSLPPGTWLVGWTVQLSGTVAGPEANNFTLATEPGGALVATSVNAGSAGTYVQTAALVTISGALTGVTVKSGNNTATSGAVYTGTITSPQTFTVTRSVNGVVKAHTAGETVELWFPSYLSLP